MSTLFISEYQYAAQAQGAGQYVPAGREPAITIQTVSIGAGSLQSNAFSSQTFFVRLHCDVTCGVVFGANPTAVAPNVSRMAAGQTEFFGVTPGMVVAVISIP